MCLQAPSPQRIAQPERRNQQRIADLQKSGELLRLSQDIRARWSDKSAVI
jgi:hypothetical protein